MPKARPPKRKNAGVGVDFKRVKRRVGRKLAPADNATDTRVVARRVGLPGQSVAEERGGAVSERNLTLKELLAQLSHYAPRVRKDALIGVADVAARHPGEVVKASGATLEALAERAADPDPAVRAALPPALAAAAAALAPAGGLAPFLPLLMAHARRAMTATDPGTRRDALGVAARVASLAPRGAARPHVAAALAQCAAALARGERATSLKSGSLEALAGAVGGVKSFLTAALEAGGGAPAPSPPPAASGPLFARKAAWPIDDAHASPSSDRAGATALLASLAAALDETAAAEGAAAAAAAADVVDCASLLLRADPGLTGDPAAVALAAAVGARLPAPAPTGAAPSASLDAAAALNVAAARFLAAMLPREKDVSALPPWSGRLLGWCDAVAASGDALPPAPGTPPPPSPLRPLPDPALPALITCLDAGLLASGRARGAAHASALAALAARAPPPAPAGAAAVTAVAAVLADPRGRGAAVGEAGLAAWVAALPRWCWEAASGEARRGRGGRPTPSTDAALAALLDAARYRPPGDGPLAATLAAAATQLPALLAPTPAAPVGPLARLPFATSAPYAAAWHYLPVLPRALLTGAAAVVVAGEGAAGDAAALGERALVVAARRVAGGGPGVDAADLAKAVAKLLSGGGGDWPARARALAAARAALAAAGPAAPAIVAALAPGLLKEATAEDTGAAASAGVLTALAAVAGGDAPQPLLAAAPSAVARFALSGCPTVDDVVPPFLASHPAALRASLAETARGAAAAPAAGVAGAALALAAVARDAALRPALLDARADAASAVSALRRRLEEGGGGGAASAAVAAAEAALAAAVGE